MLDALLDEPPVFLAALLALAVFLLVVGALNMLAPRVERLCDSLAQSYDEHFTDRLRFPPLTPQAFQLGIAAVVMVSGLMVYLLGPGWGLGLTVLLVVAVGAGPGLAYVILRDRRRKTIDSVLPNVLQQLAANFRTTNDVSRALFEVAETAPAPMDHELRLIRQKENDLKSFPDALDHARRRIGSDWFDVVVAVLKTTYANGGKESDALMNLSRVFVQLTKMRERLETATSEGRMTMKFIMAMPLVVVALALVVVPDIAMQAWDSIAGKVMLGLAVLFYVASIAVAIWLSSVKV
jgi:Flp pilus assembly protein TadB